MEHKGRQHRTGITMNHILKKFIRALNRVSPPPRMMPESVAIWIDVPMTVTDRMVMNCIASWWASGVSV